jgi:hypothetical protein
MSIKTTAEEWKRRAVSESAKLNQARLIAGDVLHELEEAIRALSYNDSCSAAAVDRARVRLQQVMTL